MIVKPGLTNNEDSVKNAMFGKMKKQNILFVN